jgi:hypothetical protein
VRRGEHVQSDREVVFRLFEQIAGPQSGRPNCIVYALLTLKNDIETKASPAHCLEARFPYIRRPLSKTTKTKTATTPRGQKLRSRAGYKPSNGG